MNSKFKKKLLVELSNQVVECLDECREKDETISKLEDKIYELKQKLWEQEDINEALLERLEGVEPNTLSLVRFSGSRRELVKYSKPLEIE